MDYQLIKVQGDDIERESLGRQLTSLGFAKATHQAAEQIQKDRLERERDQRIADHVKDGPNYAAMTIGGGITGGIVGGMGADLIRSTANLSAKIVPRAALIGAGAGALAGALWAKPAWKKGPDIINAWYQEDMDDIDNQPVVDKLDTEWYVKQVDSPALAKIVEARRKKDPMNIQVDVKYPEPKVASDQSFHWVKGGKKYRTAIGEQLIAQGYTPSSVQEERQYILSKMDSAREEKRKEYNSSTRKAGVIGGLSGGFVGAALATEVAPSLKGYLGAAAGGAAILGGGFAALNHSAGKTKLKKIDNYIDSAKRAPVVEDPRQDIYKKPIVKSAGKRRFL
jgi:hypothetical protein